MNTSAVSPTAIILPSVHDILPIFLVLLPDSNAVQVAPESEDLIIVPS